MARKQQSAPRPSPSAVSAVEIGNRLTEIRARRLALEAEISAIEARFSALTKEHEALTDTHVVQQTRRKLRYPKT